MRASGHKASIGEALLRPRGDQFLARQRRAEVDPQFGALYYYHIGIYSLDPLGGQGLWCSRSLRKVRKEHVIEGTLAGPHAPQLLKLKRKSRFQTSAGHQGRFRHE